MAIYDKNRNMLILADNELSINNLLTKEEVYQLGFNAGYDEGYEAGMEECTPDYSKEPLTVEILSGGTLKLGGGYKFSFDYGANWTDGDDNYITVNQGDVIQVKSRYNQIFGFGSIFYGSSAFFNAYGNIMSVVDNENYANITALENEQLFKGFFRETNVVSAENLILPATSLTKNCYNDMFVACYSLTTPPVLPATVLANSCYAGMFYGCTSLTTAPELPATVLKPFCYEAMFGNCFSLTTAPVLPAPVLEIYCYEEMFVRCSSLNYVECLATDITAGQSTQLWLQNVSATGTFVKHPAMNDWTTGLFGIPAGWTVVDAEL